MNLDKNISQIICSVVAAVMIATLTGVVTTVVELGRMGERQDRQSIQLDKAEQNLMNLQISVASLQAVVNSQGVQILRVDDKLDLKP